jgi:hypothetical protein
MANEVDLSPAHMFPKKLFEPTSPRHNALVRAVIEEKYPPNAASEQVYAQRVEN